MTSSAKTVVYPLITAAFLLLLWEAAVDWWHVPNYLLPSPHAVAAALYRGYVQGEFWPHFIYTLESTTLGYLLGCVSALILGSILAESRTFELFAYPYIVALQSMPKVALAPLIIVWLGFDLASKVVMVAMVSFFPLFINTVVGIRQTNPSYVELMRAFSASRSRIFFRVKLPAAAGHIFAGLQIAIVLSLIGAIVAEFVASSEGLGYLIKAASVDLDVSVMFAALISLALIGVAASKAVQLLHSRFVFWERSSTSAIPME